MGRRKRRPAAAKDQQRRPAADDPPVPTPNPPHPRKGFLALTILLQAAWIAFLAVMALAG